RPARVYHRILLCSLELAPASARGDIRTAKDRRGPTTLLVPEPCASLEIRTTSRTTAAASAAVVGQDPCSSRLSWGGRQSAARPSAVSGGAGTGLTDKSGGGWRHARQPITCAARKSRIAQVARNWRL